MVFAPAPVCVHDGSDDFSVPCFDFVSDGASVAPKGRLGFRFRRILNRLQRPCVAFLHLANASSAPKNPGDLLRLSSVSTPETIRQVQTH